MDPLLGDCSLDTLQATRTSEKWTTHPPDVLPAFLAEMDFEVASAVVDAVVAAAHRSDFGYPNPTLLGEALAEYSAGRFGWEIDPSRVIASPDVMTGVSEVLHAVTAPGSAVVINPPVYPPFFFRLRQADRRLVEVPLLAHKQENKGQGDEGEGLDFEALDRSLSDPAVSAYLLCSPHNPLGRVWTPDDLRAVADLCRRHAVTLLVDEIHSPLILKGATFTPALSVQEDGAGPRTFVFTSGSKGWNIPGVKCGLIVAGSGSDAALLRARWEALFPSHLGAIATEAALRFGGEWLDAVLRQLDANRRLLGDLLAQQLPEVGYRPPEAGFLAWLDCRRLGLGTDPAALFLERGRVALSSGPDFGVEGEGHARLNIGTSPELVTEAVRRIAAAVAH